MVILIDANVILDVLMNRKEYVKESALIWKLCETEQIKGYVSALTFANIIYVLRKELTPERIRDVYDKLCLIFEFVDFTQSLLDKAAEMAWKDFEDAVQCATAEQVHADYIITRNVRDFANSKIVTYTPTELLSRIA